MSPRKYSYIFLANLLLVTQASEISNKNGETSHNERSGRYFNPFSLFSVVQFPNTACSASTGLTGTCYTASECASRGGTSSGSCASGFGKCCTFSSLCNEETAQNNTYFSSPDTIPSVCSLMIRPLNDNICQVRLNLKTLVLDDPDTNGVCRNDYIQITGGVSQSGKIPTICGSNSGQHIIYSAISNFPARLSIVVDTMKTLARSWEIQILQFECDDPCLAPEGCLQYYTGISGNVTSFNWKTTDNTNGAAFSTHLANQDYTVCVRRESGYCAIEWSTPTPSDSQVGYFSMTDAEATAPLAAANVVNGDATCTTDYVAIPRGSGGTDATAQSRERFCGQALGYCADATCTASALGPVQSRVTPFLLGVVTDGTEATPDAKNRGFNLNFRQNPCS